MAGQLLIDLDFCRFFCTAAAAYRCGRLARRTRLDRRARWWQNVCVPSTCNARRSLDRRRRHLSDDD